MLDRCVLVTFCRAISEGGVIGTAGDRYIAGLIIKIALRSNRRARWRMGYVDGRKNSKQQVELAQRVLAQLPGGFDLSGDLAVTIPALLIDGAGIFMLSLLSGMAYNFIVFRNLGEPSVFAGTGVLVAVIFCGTSRFLGTSQRTTVSRGSGRARLALTAWIMTFLFLVFVAFSLKIGAQFSRGAILSFFVLGMPMVVASRVFAPRILARTLYANAYRGSEVILATSQESASQETISHELRARGCQGVHTIAFDGACDAIEWPTERQRLLKRIIETARVAGPGEIYLWGANIGQERIVSILAGLRLVPRAIFVIPDESVASFLSRPVRRVGASVAIEMQRVPSSALARAIKRAVDIAVAGAALAFMLPIFVVIALAIKLDSPGPIFFRQGRNGYRGRPFRILKFRTMTVLEDGEVVRQARRDDRRVTRVGRWLRKTSFDELPQLLNIFKGEMSLVGPRPHAIAHDELYAKLIEDYELRQHVKPGVTGWAQVNGLRGETPTIDLMFRRIECDLWYAANYSIALDLKILARTALVVLRQDNAY